MTNIYLASSIDVTAERIARAIGNVSTLKTVFITTAAEGETGDKSWLNDDRNGMIKAGFKLFDYTITGKSPEDIEKATQDMGKEISSMEMHSGRNQNLRKSKIIEEGLARRSNIIEVKGLDEDKASFVVNKSGKIQTSLPKKNEIKAKKLYKIIEKIMDFIS